MARNATRLKRGRDRIIDPEGRRRLMARLAGPPTRRREAMVKALAMLGASAAPG